MKITVQRTSYGTQATEGALSLDNDPFTCVTLEPFARPAGAPKVQNKTAIPAGTYPVEINFSPHFNRDMPLLDAVPNFSAVRIHWGNTDAATDGCILVGRATLNQDFISASIDTFNELFPKIQAAIDATEGCSITIIDGPGAP
jgi:hypothetical protein